jgi:uncharacterized iron-regulated protein
MSRPRIPLPLAGFISSSLLIMAAASLAAQSDAPSPEPVPAFQEGQIWEVKEHRVITFDALAAELLSSEVIYLGEEHHNRWHVESALLVLRALISQGRHPVLALEMFGWDGQAALDRYVSHQDEAQDRFLRESRWEENWGGPFDDYAPLIALARTDHLAVLALNPPRPLVRLVAKRGLAQALADPGMAEWGMKDEHYPEDSSYRDMITKPLRRCHGGLSDGDYQRMYEASMFRDEGMAKTIAESLRRAGTTPDLQGHPMEGPIVSYTGGGHIQYQLPVPSRVQRRRVGSIRHTTIYMTSFDPSRTEEIRALLTESIADYVWLTPVGAHGTPRRCR